MLVLTANKTKMLRLVHSFGFDPPRGAEFTKAFRDRHWWLEWEDENNSYKANLSIYRGEALLGMRQREYGSTHPEKWTVWNIPLKQLREYGMLEELAPKANAPKKQPDHEPEL